MTTLKELLIETRNTFEQAGFSTAALDARILVLAATGFRREDLVLKHDQNILEAADELLDKYVTRRLKREPVSKILGEREFWGMPFMVSEHTLDPRPDSETVIETVKHLIGEKRSDKLKVLDLGTGSGCLLLSILSEFPEASGLGVDISQEALDVARQNAKNLGFEKKCNFKCHSWDKLSLEDTFDVIVSNPPYIPAAEIDLLEPEVARFDPRVALDGGNDGLRCYREIANVLPHVLHEDAFAVLEIGFNQAEQVSEIFNNSDLSTIKVIKDLAGNDRCILVRRKNV